MKIVLVIVAIALVTGVAFFFINAGTATQRISQQDFQKIMTMEEAPLLLDVRTAEEFAEGHVPEAMNISYDLLAGRLSELGDDKTQEIVVYCRSGRRAGVAETILQNAGFKNLKHLEGDMIGWEKSGLKIEKSPKLALPKS